jgi:hypothetical protein
MAEYHSRGGSISQSHLTPEQRATKARLAAEARWARERDRDGEATVTVADAIVIISSTLASKQAHPIILRQWENIKQVLAEGA